MALPYYPLTAAGVNNPTLINADLLYLDGHGSGYSGKSGFSGQAGAFTASGYSGFSGKSGYSGVSGVNPLIESATFPGTIPTELLWNRTDEALYAAVSGYTDWIQVGAGTSGYSGRDGASGYSGLSGFSGYSGVGTSGYSGQSGFSGTISERATFPTFVPADLMWNTVDQALYAGLNDGNSNWVQVGAGNSGYSGRSGYSGVGFVTSFYSFNISDSTVVNWNNGLKQRMTIDSTNYITTSILFSNSQTAANYSLMIKYSVDATVGTFTGVLWPSGLQPLWSGDTSKCDLVGLFYDGTSLLGVPTLGLK